LDEDETVDDIARIPPGTIECSPPILANPVKPPRKQFIPVINPGVADSIQISPSSIYILDSKGSRVRLQQEGIFATQSLPKGTLVAIFDGTIINAAEFQSEKRAGRGRYGVQLASHGCKWKIPHQ
jgi:hypothetical protein